MRFDDISRFFIVELVSTYSSDRGWEFSYLRIAADRYRAFKEAAESRPLELTDFGDVLFTGAGRNPTPELASFFEAVWGIDHDLETEVRTLALSEAR